MVCTRTTDRVVTFVDGVACREPDPDAFAIIVRGAARLRTVPDDETASACGRCCAPTHNLTEPAGALDLAALMLERDLQRGRRVGVVSQRR